MHVYGRKVLNKIVLLLFILFILLLLSTDTVGSCSDAYQVAGFGVYSTSNLHTQERCVELWCVHCVQSHNNVGLRV